MQKRGVDFVKKYYVHVTVYIILFIFSGSVSYLVLNKLQSQVPTPLETNKFQESAKVVTIFPTPTAVPFKELTIPYLRGREYKSEITDLQKVADKGEFTAYTASYDSDSFNINAYLTIPNGPVPEGGWPAVVFVHGYIPPTIYKTLTNYVSYADSMARNGLVVFKIDLRGHGDSEGQAFGAYYSGNYVIDTLNAYDALQKFENVNPQKVGLWGHSMAGNITFRSFVAKNIPKLVIWAGAVFTYDDLQDYRINDNSYRPPVDQSERQKFRKQLIDTHGEFAPTSEYWKQVVPTNYLEGLTGSVQIHHSINDNVVDIGYSRNLESVLNSAGIINELFEYPSGGHNITGASYTKSIEMSAKFLKSY